jgi:hypothetical protein
MHRLKKNSYKIKLLLLLSCPIFFSFSACSGQKSEYSTFADYPGFSEYYGEKCSDTISLTISDKDRVQPPLYSSS